MRRHRGLQVVTSSDGDEATGIDREHVGDRTCIAAQQGRPGKDQGTGVDGLAREPRAFVLLTDELTEHLSVYPGLVNIWCEQDVGLVQNLSLGNQVACLLALEYEP